MKAGSLFSGIAGFEIAAIMEGFEIAWQCEKDPFCLDLLETRFPGVPKIDDVHKVNTRDHEAVELIFGGFPCQPFSSAGKREGTEDERHLWPEMLRIIKDFRPRWVVGENVYGLTVGEMAPVFDQVVLDLEGAGYDVWPVVFPACALDAPHIRQRVWIVASLVDADSERRKKHNGASFNGEARFIGGRRDKRENTEPTDTESQRFRKARQRVGRPEERSSGNTAQHPNAESRTKERPGQPRAQARRIEGRFDESRVLGVGDGLSDWMDRPVRWEERMGDYPSPRIAEANERSSRISALGNAVVPYQVQVIFRYIKLAEAA